jgi:hypothetical protein
VSPVTDGWLAADVQSDDALLAELRRAISAREAVPEEFMRAARNAFAWHNIDAELAQLTYDSVHLQAGSAPTRAEPAGIRALTFTSTQLTIELEVTADSLLGQIVPAQVATIEVQTRADVSMVVEIDEIGCFVIQPIPGEPFRMRVRADAGTEVLTGWITL